MSEFDPEEQSKPICDVVPESRGFDRYRRIALGLGGITLLAAGLAGCRDRLAEPTDSHRRANGTTSSEYDALTAGLASVSPALSRSAETPQIPSAIYLSAPATPKSTMAEPLVSSYESITPGTEKFKIAQDMIVGFDASTPKATIRQVVADTRIGGIFLTGTTDAVGAGFTPRFYDRLSELAGARMLVASDEEGGKVHRLAYDFNFPSAKEMGTMTRLQVRHIGRRVGQQMLADGAYLDLAPVLDIDRGKDEVIDVLGRSFGSDTTEISHHAQAFMNGLHDSGVEVTLKHFVGLTSAAENDDSVILDNSDAHKVVTRGWLAYLKDHDYKPYKILVHGPDAAHISAIMIGNMIIPGLTDGKPASISSAAYKQLDDVGFKGLKTTDALSALSAYDGLTQAQNVAHAVRAGADAPLFSFTTEQTILDAIQRIKDRVPAARIDASYAKVVNLKHPS